MEKGRFVDPWLRPRGRSGGVRRRRGVAIAMSTRGRAARGVVTASRGAAGPSAPPV